MDDIPTREGIIDTASCPSCPLRRRPSMMKRLRKSFRRAVSNKEAMASDSKVYGALRPSLSAEMLHSPEAFTEEPCAHRDRSYSDRMTFSATTLWDNLVSYLEANVNPGTRRRSLRMYNNCFFGHEAVNCLHKYITTDLSRQCDREQVAVLCHRFLVLGIIEDAKCANEFEKDFNTGLLYRLTAQKKFWEVASLKSEDEESDGNYREESPVTLTHESHDSDCKKPEEEISDKCSKNMQRRKSLRQSLLEGVRWHLKENKPRLDRVLPLTTEEHSDTESKQSSYSSTDAKLSTNDADSSGSSSKGAETQTTTMQQKAKKSSLTRKRRWHSIKEKSHKTGNKQTHLIPQLKTKMTLKKKKQNISSSETNKQWVTFGYI